ncbi:hypothetical protein [uncultured Roseobacter sp.]|uniref:hypothetical protein n=1 Tax=uncultured Roseobacter sp. TaxID=114847 RepID=UPI0026316749|nr:hypothetical protein [uncultured Roseobacter sp.]
MKQVELVERPLGVIEPRRRRRRIELLNDVDQRRLTRFLVDADVLATAGVGLVETHHFRTFRAARRVFLLLDIH